MNETSNNDWTIGLVRTVMVALIGITALACADVAEKQSALSFVMDRVSR
jgi:hypothetical protein